MLHNTYVYTWTNPWNRSNASSAVSLPTSEPWMNLRSARRKVANASRISGGREESWGTMLEVMSKELGTFHGVSGVCGVGGDVDTRMTERA